MTVRRMVSCFLAAALVAGQAQAADSGTYSASGAWVADYAQESCAVQRTFTKGTDSLILAFRQYGPNVPLEVSVAGRNLKVRPRGLQARLLPGDTPEAIEAANEFQPAEGWEGLVFEDGRSAEAVPQGATGYAVSSSGGSYEFATGSLDAPMKLLGECVRELADLWGRGAATPIRQPAKEVDAGVLRRQLDRTLTALHENRQLQVVRLRMLVNKGGRAGSCKVVAMPDDDVYAARLCSVAMAEARFEPARDAASQPVDSYYLLRLPRPDHVEWEEGL